MSKLIINTGSAPNDGAGDSLRDGADKINANFTEVYGALGPNTTLSVGFGRTVIGISATTFNVGVGSTNPTSKFQVLGDLSATSYKLGSTEIVSSAGQLKNISSLDATTTATIESAVSNAPNTFTDLNVAGLTTLSNARITNLSLTGITTGLNVPGISTFGFVVGTSFQSTTLNVSGISTLSSIQGTNLNYSGISTLSTIQGTNLNYSGISTLSSIQGTNLNYTGISTLSVIRGTHSNITGVSSVGSGTTITDGHIEVTGIVTANGYVAGSGTNTIPAFQFSTGTLLTGNGTLGAVEYDGQSYYATGVTTGGRGFIPVTNLFRLESNRQILAATGQPGVATNFFDPGLIPLVGNGEYEIDFDLYFTKGTTGVTTFTLSTPTAPALINAIVTTTPVTGVSTNTPAAPQMITAVGSALTSTGLSLTLNNTTHYAKISVFLENGSANTNTLTLNIMNNNSTCIPLRGSRWKSTLLSRNAGIGVTQ
jgi:hypothetical protein